MLPVFPSLKVRLDYINMALCNAKRFKTSETGFNKCLRYAFSSVCRCNHEMLKVSTPSVMAGHDAACYFVPDFRNKAQSRISFQIAAGIVIRVGVAEGDTRRFLHQSHDRIIVIDRHGNDREHYWHLASSGETFLRRHGPATMLAPRASLMASPARHRHRPPRACAGTISRPPAPWRPWG